MSPAPGEQRFSGTRGQILALLRRASRTVDELAKALDLTGNAVRSHLATLERDGLVQHSGVRRGAGGAGKPAYLYKLTPQAEQLFPKAFELVLRSLLDILTKRLDPEGYEELLRSVGRDMAVQQDIPAGDIRTRLNGAVAVLTDMGGLMELEENDGVFSICGYSCPLSTVAFDHPEVCRLMETFITTLVSVPAHERCERSESLACWFEVPNSSSLK